MVLADIQDGRIWKQFLHYGTDSRDFLQSPNNFAFMLNVDCFQPAICHMSILLILLVYYT